MIELLYISSEDVSRPNGPGINELQFIISAAREYQNRVHFIIPDPARTLPEQFPFDRTTTVTRLVRRSPATWLSHISSLKMTGLKLIRELSPDYVVFRMAFLPIAEARIAKEARVAFLKTATDGQFPSFHGLRPARALLPLQAWTYGQALKEMRAIDVVTDIHKHLLEQSYPIVRGRVHVFDNAADTDVFKPVDRGVARSKLGINKFRHLIGYVGNLAHERGACELLESWQFIDQREEVGIVIVSGDGVGIKKIRSQAQALGIANRLTVLGPVQFSDLPEHIGLLDIGVSFRDDDGCSELKVRQYLACGVPVIASARVNAFMEDAGVGLLVSRDDPRAAGEAASEILAGRACSDRLKIREYASAHLSYRAAVRERRRFWGEQSQCRANA